MLAKKRGPAATGKGLQIVTRMHDDLLQPLDAFAASEPDAPTRPEAVRRIVRDWLVGRGYLHPERGEDGKPK